MGGQETLLLLGQFPGLLERAVALDSVTNFYRRYRDFPATAGGVGLQALCRMEVGGTPQTNAAGYVLRSPSHWVKEIARSKVPLQLWWSLGDQIVTDQVHQSAHFFEEVRKQGGRIEAVTGFWKHSQPQRHDRELPKAVRFLGLLPQV
jgi:hypothetical protein